jgi:hypothetical protein
MDPFSKHWSIRNSCFCACKLIDEVAYFIELSCDLRNSESVLNEDTGLTGTAYCGAPVIALGIAVRAGSASTVWTGVSVAVAWTASGMEGTVLECTDSWTDKIDS